MIQNMVDFGTNSGPENWLVLSAINRPITSDQLEIGSRIALSGLLEWCNHWGCFFLETACRHAPWHRLNWKTKSWNTASKKAQVYSRPDTTVPMHVHTQGFTISAVSVLAAARTITQHQWRRASFISIPTRAKENPLLCSVKSSHVFINYFQFCV